MVIGSQLLEKGLMVMLSRFHVSLFNEEDKGSIDEF